MKSASLHLQKADPVLKRIIEAVGPCRIPYREPDFSTLARAIVFQQLNGAAARTIFDRVLAVLDHGRLTPRNVLQAPVAGLRGAGLSARKTEYLRDLAEKTASGAIRFQLLAAKSDEEVIAALTEVRGIGVWSAHMFLLFALRRPDVLAVGDYGVRSAVKKAYGLKELPTARELEKIAEPWHPHSSAACWYLWQSLRIKTV